MGCQTTSVLPSRDQPNPKPRSRPVPHRLLPGFQVICELSRGPIASGECGSCPLSGNCFSERRIPPDCDPVLTRSQEEISELSLAHDMSG
jgi:hypothetical protein